jgi:hypothetical protein
MLLGSCSSGSKAPADLQPAELPQVVLEGIPALPFDHPLPRSVRTIQVSELQGSDTFQVSPGVTIDGATAQVVSGAGLFEYAIYQFALGSVNPKFVDANFTVNSGENAWLGVGNFARDRWEFIDNFSADPSLRALTNEHISLGGNVYILIVSFDLTDITVSSVALTYDDGLVPSGDISGHVEMLGSGMPGVVLTLAPGGDQETTDANGDYSFEDIAVGNYTITPSLTGFTFEPTNRQVSVEDGVELTGQDFDGTAVTGGPSISGVILNGLNPLANVKVVLIEYTGVNSIQGDVSTFTDELGAYSFADLDEGTYRVVPLLSGFAFTPNRVAVTVDGEELQDFAAQAVSIPATVNYTSHMRPWLFEPICMNCHSSEFGPGERNSAPSNVNWDTYGGTTQLQKTSGNGRVQADTMPPSFLLSELRTTTFQRELFQAWLDDGFPEN